MKSRRYLNRSRWKKVKTLTRKCGKICVGIGSVHVMITTKFSKNVQKRTYCKFSANLTTYWTPSQIAYCSCGNCFSPELKEKETNEQHLCFYVRIRKRFFFKNVLNCQLMVSLSLHHLPMINCRTESQTKNIQLIWKNKPNKAETIEHTAIVWYEESKWRM